QVAVFRGLEIELGKRNRRQLTPSANAQSYLFLLKEVVTMPRLTSTAPCFSVADVGETIRWYELQLGFEGIPFPKTAPHAFGILVRDQIEIMLQRVEGYRK